MSKEWQWQHTQKFTIIWFDVNSNKYLSNKFTVTGLFSGISHQSTVSKRRKIQKLRRIYGKFILYIRYSWMEKAKLTFDNSWTGTFTLWGMFAPYNSIFSTIPHFQERPLYRRKKWACFIKLRPICTIAEKKNPPKAI